MDNTFQEGITKLQPLRGKCSSLFNLEKFPACSLKVLRILFRTLSTQTALRCLTQRQGVAAILSLQVVV